MLNNPSLVVQFRASPVGSFTHLSEEWKLLVGDAPSSGLGTAWLDKVHGDDRERVRGEWERAMSEGLDFRSRFRILQNDGPPRSVFVTASRFEEAGGLEGFYMGSFSQLTAEFESVVQKRLYEAIFASTPDFAYVFGIDHRLVYANPALLEMWGMTWDEAIGKDFHELGYETWHAEMHQNEMNTVIRTRTQWRAEIPFTGTHGRRIYDYIFVPVLDADGEVTAVAGTTRDVTDDRVAAELLQQNETLFSKIIDQAPGGVYVVDDEFRLIKANPLAAPTFAAAEPVIGRDFTDVMEILWGREIGRDIVGKFRHTLETGERYQAPRFSGVREDLKEYRSYDWEIQRLTLPSGKQGVVCYFSDVTDQIEMEQALRASEERANDIIRSITDGFLTVDREWRITYISQLGREILLPFKESGDAMVGKVFWEEFPAMVGTEIEENFRLAMDDQVALEFEADYVPLDAWFDLRVYPSSSGLSLFFLDITERKRSEAALQHSRMVLAEQAEKLRDVDRRKDQFLATLAHELRNPLAPIVTGLEVIKGSGYKKAVVEKVSGIITRQMSQMVHLIDDLLDISRVNTGKITLKRSEVLLTEVISNAIEATEPLMQQFEHRLDVKVPSEEIRIVVDCARVAQVMSNLLSNAAKYTPPGGKIALEAGTRGNGVWIRVKDNGKGIDPADQAKIFDLFQQTDHGNSEGLGIGLTLVRSLVELHGGTITVSSQGRARGSVFEVELPDCRVVDSKAAPATADVGEGDYRSKRVLVVDDGKSAAEILAMFFRMEGMEVELAFDGAEALEKLEGFTPDLILMDLGMPNIDGWEAARLMRERGVSSVIVALSGWGREEDKLKTAAAGFNDHLVKPVTPADLRLLMHRFFTKKADGSSD